MRVTKDIANYLGVELGERFGFENDPNDFMITYYGCFMYQGFGDSISWREIDVTVLFERKEEIIRTDKISRTIEINSLGESVDKLKKKIYQPQEIGDSPYNTVIHVNKVFERIDSWLDDLRR